MSAMSPRSQRLLDLYLVASFGQATATGLAALIPDLSRLQLYRYVFTNADRSGGVQYLVTSDLALAASSMTTIYRKRWKTEEYHKSLKSNASFARSATKWVRTQSNPFFACLVAFVKMESYHAETCLNHFALKGRLFQAALASALRKLQTLKALCQPGPTT